MREVCIIGFGFTAVPLVRELEATGTDYQIISDNGENVWTNLNKKERLDFDLVTNYLSSFYSFDLVKNYDKDYYPTASEFFEMHKRLRKEYEDKILRDVVKRVDNFKDYSEIVTESGKTIKARHVVFSTGFQRSIHTNLTDIDYNVSNKTFVLDTIGDSANLIMSNLIPRNNKIIIRTNGFLPLDKVLPIAGTTFTLDQLEFHNFRYVSQAHYTSIIQGKPTDNPFLLSTQFPSILRDRSHITTKSTPPSGTIVIKYWPIDIYAKEFGDNLENSIAKGYLLNDIAMWIKTGKAIVVPKDSPIDFDKKTISYGGIERSYHMYIKGDSEQPRLPKIMINGSIPYQYSYRENFMGVIPKKLNNIYTIGYTRPMTGGVANIAEMQCIFVHKLVTQSAFRKKIRHNLDERISKYNYHYYGTTPPGRSDHSVYYGFYTDDIARLMGIDYKPTECATMKDLVFYYAFPNNAFKYRLKGEYAVEGVDKLIDKINTQFKDFMVIFAYILTSNRFSGEERKEWLKQQSRFLFNDMRPKKEFKSFLEDYFKAYRNVKNINIVNEVDEEWNQLVKIAGTTRDRLALECKDLSIANWSEEINEAADLVKSMAIDEIWKVSGQSIENLQGHFSLLSSMKDPQEYEKPYLNSSMIEKVR